MLSDTLAAFTEQLHEVGARAALIYDGSTTRKDNPVPPRMLDGVELMLVRLDVSVATSHWASFSSGLNDHRCSPVVEGAAYPMHSPHDRLETSGGSFVACKHVHSPEWGRLHGGVHYPKQDGSDLGRGGVIAAGQVDA